MIIYMIAERRRFVVEPPIDVTTELHWSAALKQLPTEALVNSPPQIPVDWTAVTMPVRTAKIAWEWFREPFDIFEPHVVMDIINLRLTDE
jgi:hypothetical protein